MAEAAVGSEEAVARATFTQVEAVLEGSLAKSSVNIAGPVPKQGLFRSLGTKAMPHGLTAIILRQRCSNRHLLLRLRKAWVLHPMAREKCKSIIKT